MLRFARLFTLLKVAIKYRLHEFLSGEDRDGDRNRRLRLAFEDLGPIFIKFGQLLSTRRDFLDPALADELQSLQDDVPPFSSPGVADIISRSLGMPAESVFAQLDEQPFASASVAQVYKARLKNDSKDGSEVVVKVLRPGMDKVVAADIRLLKWLANLLETWSETGRRLRPVEVVADYEQVIRNELDLQVEAANTAQLRRNFADSEDLYVPEVYWQYSRRNVLVMERIHGIPISDVARLKAQGIPLKELAETGVKLFFTQVFEHNFFHADMHPGNIFVALPDDKSPPQYIAIDCAIIGSLSRDDQEYLARNLLAIFQRDYRKVAELHIACGWVSPQTKVHEFEAAMRGVCEPVFARPLGEISFGHLLLQLFRTAGRFDMTVQPSLVLLQKTLLNIEGLGRQLYPQLDLWQTALPYLENWQQQRLSPALLLERLKESLPQLIEQMPEVIEGLPRLLVEAAETAGRGGLERRLAAMGSGLEAARRQLRRMQRGQWLGLGLLLGLLLMLLLS